MSVIARQLLYAVTGGGEPTEVDGGTASSHRRRLKHRLERISKDDRRGGVEPVDNDEVSVDAGDGDGDGEDCGGSESVGSAGSKKKKKRRSGAAYWSDMKSSISKSTGKYVRASRRRGSGGGGSVSSCSVLSDGTSSTRGSKGKTTKGNLGSVFKGNRAHREGRIASWGDLGRTAEYGDEALVPAVPSLDDPANYDRYDDGSSFAASAEAEASASVLLRAFDDGNSAFEESNLESESKVSGSERRKHRKKSKRKGGGTRRSRRREMALDESQHSEMSEMSTSTYGSVASSPRSANSVADGSWGDFARMHRNRGALSRDDAVVSPAHWADDGFSTESVASFTRVPHHDGFGDLDDRRLLGDAWDDVFALTPERTDGSSYEEAPHSGSRDYDDDDDDGMSFITRALFGKEVLANDDPDFQRRRDDNASPSDSLLPMLQEDSHKSEVPKAPEPEEDPPSSSHLIEMIMRGTAGLDRAALLSKMDKTLPMKSRMKRPECDEAKVEEQDQVHISVSYSVEDEQESKDESDEQDDENGVIAFLKEPSESDEEEEVVHLKDVRSSSLTASAVIAGGDDSDGGEEIATFASTLSEPGSTASSVVSPARSVRFADELCLPMEEVFYLGGPDDAGATHRIIVLLLNAAQRKFEFIQTEFRIHGVATVSNLLSQIPDLATNHLFQGKCYVAVFRMAGDDGDDDCIELPVDSLLSEHDFDRNEVVVGVMEGTTGPEMVGCARPLLANEKIARAVKSARRSGRGLKYIFSTEELDAERSEAEAAATEEEEEDFSDFEDAMVSEDDIDGFDGHEDFDCSFTKHGSPMPKKTRQIEESPTQYVEYAEPESSTVVRYLHAGLMATVGVFYGYGSSPG